MHWTPGRLYAVGAVLLLFLGALVFYYWLLFEVAQRILVFASWIIEKGIAGDP